MGKTDQGAGHEEANEHSKGTSIRSKDGWKEGRASHARQHEYHKRVLRKDIRCISEPFLHAVKCVYSTAVRLTRFHQLCLVSFRRRKGKQA